MISEIDSKINVMTRKVDCQLEKLVVGKLPDERSSVGINRKQIEIVADIVRIFFDQPLQLCIICLVAG